MKLFELRRLRLRRSDGRVFLDRWGIGNKRIGQVYLHRMQAPDPGLDLHDHPWTFVSIVLKGGYAEERAATRDAVRFARVADKMQHGTFTVPRGLTEQRERWSVRRLRLDECHRITTLHAKTVWTLVVTGPVRRPWGFYMADGFIDEPTYNRTVRSERRDLWEEGGNACEHDFVKVEPGTALDVGGYECRKCREWRPAGRMSHRGDGSIWWEYLDVNGDMFGASWRGGPMATKP